MTKIPENSDATESPDDLQQTTYTCGHDGCERDFATAEDLAEHTVKCPHGEPEQGGE